MRFTAPLTREALDQNRLTVAEGQVNGQFDAAAADLSLIPRKPLLVLLLESCIVNMSINLGSRKTFMAQ